MKNPACIVDCNHANSDKRPLEQMRIAQDVLHSRRQHPGLRRLIRGLMVESYLVDGAAIAGTQAFVQSITDPCLGGGQTEQMILRIAESLAGEAAK